jgi:hypothetical protein
MGLTQLKSQAISNATLKAPIDRLLERATERKYAVKKDNGNFRATSRRALTGLPEKEIVNKYYGKEVTKLYYPESLKTKVDFKRGQKNIYEFSCIYKNEIFGSYRMQIEPVKDKCEMEGCESSENLELHYLTPQKNISKKLTAFEKSIIVGQRKTITLCREHDKKLV